MSELEKIEAFFRKLYDISNGKYEKPLNELQDMIEEASGLMDNCFDLRNYIVELEQANGLKVKVSA